MRLLQPAQVSGEIINLLDKARQHVIIVSPYNKIKNWHKLAPYLQRLHSRQLPVEYYVRQERPRGNNFQEVVDAGFSPIEIEGLHCKFYLNETVGIVTSMNLLLSSDVQALEIGYVTETAREYDELWTFFLDNIKSRIPAFGEPGSTPILTVVTPSLELPDTSLSQLLVLPPLELTDVSASQLPVLEPAEPVLTVVTPPFELRAYLFTALQQRPLFHHLTVQGKNWECSLTDSVSVRIAVRAAYVQVTYVFPYRLRYQIYKHLKTQQVELEQALGLPLAWGWQQHAVKLELDTLEQRPMNAWQAPEAEQASDLIQQAGQLIAEKVAAFTALAAT